VSTPFRRGALLLDLNACALLSAALLRDELQAAGIKPSHLDLLTEIQLVGPLTPTELAARTGYRPATLYDSLEELVRLGQVERAAHPRDRRSHVLATTAEGTRIVQASGSAVGRVLHALSAHAERPLEELEEVMYELRQALQATVRARAPARD